MTFNLREARHNSGLSIAKLAKEIGISKATLGRAEAGTTEPLLEHRHKIAKHWAEEGYTGPDGEPLRVTDIWPLPDQEAAAA